MDKILVRNNQEHNEVLSTSEFETLAFDQISHISLDLSFSKDTEQVLVGMSDILELMRQVLVAKNIDPVQLFAHAEHLRSEYGSFSDLKAVEQNDE